MSERIMKNFPIEYEGQIYWRSRSVAVVGFIFCQDQHGNWNILAEKRGPGCPNEVGKYCVVCGYLDFDDKDGEYAVGRETFEETGLNIHPSQFKFQKVTFSEENDKNVSLIYTCVLRFSTIDDWKLSNEHNEEGETSDIRWIPIKDIHGYNLAFNHEKLIKEMHKKLGLSR